MGSVLCGRLGFIDKARKYRKALGGGQRQVGIAAAAGLVALRDMRGRLREDHENAALLAELLDECGAAVEDVPNRTNMVFFNLADGQCGAQELIKRCKGRGLLIGSPGGRRVRMVTHLGIGSDDVRSAAGIIKEAAPL
jgi:threonine aldolase